MPNGLPGNGYCRFIVPCRAKALNAFKVGDKEFAADTEDDPGAFAPELALTGAGCTNTTCIARSFGAKVFFGFANGDGFGVCFLFFAQPDRGLVDFAAEHQDEAPCVGELLHPEVMAILYVDVSPCVHRHTIREFTKLSRPRPFERRLAARFLGAGLKPGAHGVAVGPSTHFATGRGAA